MLSQFEPVSETQLDDSFGGLPGANSVAVSNDSLLFYVANGDDNSVSVLARNPGDGSLSVLQTITDDDLLDPMDPEGGNVELSRQRAEVATAYLVEKGVPPAIVSTRGWGSSYPTESDRTAKGRRHNRRVEVFVP